MTHDHEFAVEHDHVEPLLAEHALGTTEPGHRERIEAHLGECTACRTTLDELALAVAGLEQRALDPALAPVAGAREALVAAARATPQDGRAPASTRRRPRRRPSPSWLAAGVASLACVALAFVVVDRQDRIGSLERRLDDARGDQVPVLKGASISDLDIGGPFGDTRAQVVLKRDAGIITFRKVPAPPTGMAWQVSAVDSDERIHTLGVIDGERELAILSIDGIDADDIERVIVTTEPIEPADDPAPDGAERATV